MIDPMFEPEVGSSAFITGSRAYGRPFETQRIVEIEMAALMKRPTIKAVYLGAADGIDTLCLKTLRAFREKVGADGPYLIAVCPCTMSEVPDEARAMVERCADRIIELENRITVEDGWDSFKIRNRYLVDHAAHGRAFWNGKPGGTLHAMTYAKSLKRDLWILDIPPPQPKNQRIPVPANKRR